MLHQVRIQDLSKDQCFFLRLRCFSPWSVYFVASGELPVEHAGHASEQKEGCLGFSWALHGFYFEAKPHLLVTCEHPT